MYYDTSRFALTATLEQNWRGIYEEYLAVREAIVDWRGKRLYDQGWKVFVLYEYPTGEPVADNIARCPFTDALVRAHIPAHGVIGFSVLLPQTRVKPHQDVPGSYVRCHLGLQVPEGDCGMKVNGELRKWVPGRALMFDNTIMHETWNLTAEERVVFFLDFLPEPGELPSQPRSVPG
jgi:beta-hydroxylase